MFAYHLAGDPAGQNVYAFYAQTFPVTMNGLGPAYYQSLICRKSTDGGATWNAGIQVMNGNIVAIPQNGYAPVPNNSGTTDGGYYRFGRVWACVDSNGGVHVVWFDNRAGAWDTSRDLWDVYKSDSTDGLTWSTPVKVSDDSSPGGYGLPPTGSDPLRVHCPPGDFLSC